MLIRWLSLVLLCLCMSAPARAENYDFYLHNRSNGWVINGFYTYEDGRWSRNWLDRRIRPGSSESMLWNSQSGSCNVPFRVSWVDWGTQDFTMNWCNNNPSNIYMRDQGFTWN